MGANKLTSLMSDILTSSPTWEEQCRRADIVRYTLNAFSCERVCDVPDNTAPDFVRLFRQKYMEADQVLRALSVYDIL